MQDLVPAQSAAAAQALAAPITAGTLDAYIRQVNGISVLSFEEEQRLALEWHKEGRLQAAQQLVVANLRFVVHVARGYAGYGLGLADLIQEGNVGLMKAVRRFDPAVGVRLVSFAVHWIRAEIHEFVLRNWRIVKVATTKAQRKLFFNLRSSKKRLGWLRPEEVQAVANDLGVKPETVLEMEARLSAQDASFDPGPDKDDDMPASSPGAWLPAANADPSELVEAHDHAKRNQEGLHLALEQLNERSRDIIISRWLQEPKATLQELADKYSVSAERVRQLEKAAMQKISQAMQS